MSEADVIALKEIKDEQERLEYLQAEIEERYLAGTGTYAAESDKSWDAMHRALADGALTWDGGTYPLNHAVLAGELLYSEPDYIMSLKAPTQVQDIAKALMTIDEGEFRRRYFAIDSESYGFPLSEDDFEYTWSWFQSVRELYETAAKEARFVLFTADQ